MSAPIWSAWRAEKEHARRAICDRQRSSVRVTRQPVLSVHKHPNGRWIASMGNARSRAHNDPLSAAAEALETWTPSMAIDRQTTASLREWNGARGYSRGYAFKYRPVEIHRYLVSIDGGAA